MMDTVAASKQIGAILASLERDTGQIVTDVQIIDMDITMLMDDKQQLQRRVQINMQRIPGSKWAQ